MDASDQASCVSALCVMKRLLLGDWGSKSRETSASSKIETKLSM